ncbi:MAG TPA: hypothetical protein VFC07_00375 [Verrucomicrobiae bacterium]|nr:hypothetical protein [Verrucomicrobiae bacterium]
MKQNLKEDILNKKSPGLFALVAVLALGVSVAAYDEVHQKIHDGERDLVMVDRLNDIAHLHVLLAQLSTGRLEEAKHQLKTKLADELAAINPLVESSSQQAAGYARCILTQMDHDQKTHPDYYLVSSPPLTQEKIKVLPSDRQVAATKLVNQ